MRALILIALWLSGMVAWGQTEISVSGKITHALTGAGITASIHYQSLPTGGISGRFNDSTFQFGIFGTAKYQITAEAPGFLPNTVIVDPKGINSSQQLIRNIPLTPEGQTIELKTLNFELGKAVIRPESYAGLDEMVAMMKTNQKMVIQLEGHTDIAGDAGMNMKLSQKRVDAVREYMGSKGVARNRIKTKAFGGTQPLSRDRSTASQNANRRVEMRVLEH